MVTKIFPLIVIYLLILGTVSAVSSPMPVSLKIINEGNLDNYEIIQTNERTGESIQIFTDSNGFALYDWSNSELGWYPSDNMEILIVTCEEFEACTINTQISSSGNPIFFIVDLTGIYEPDCEVCDTCPDPEVCDDCSDPTCPEIPACPTCPTCPACPDYPDIPTCDTCDCPADGDIFAWAMGLLGAVLGISGSLTVFYRNQLTGRWKKVTSERIEDGTVKKEAG